MTEDKQLIKFLSVPSRRTVKDFIGSICRKLNFTRSNYKEINGVFVESLNNNRYHLHVYARDDEFKDKLETAGKSTSDPNYRSMEINNTNHLFVLPPFNNSVYRVYPMERHCEFYEKVVEFTTGVHQTIMDVLLLIESNKFKIRYVVCNRARTFIGFYNGTDAMEMIEILRTQNYSPKYASCYAKFVYVEKNNQSQINDQPRINRFNEDNNITLYQRSNNQVYPHRMFGQNMITQRRNYMRREDNVFRRSHRFAQPQNMVASSQNIVASSQNIMTRPQHIVVPQQQFITPHYNVGYARQNPRYVTAQHRNHVTRRTHNRINNNLNGARFVRVMFPDNLQNNQYEMRLVRRY